LNCSFGAEQLRPHIQHLSGIATETRRYADALSGMKTKITHTRKTTPGLRFVEQQAVCHGGGMPHRLNLATCVMLKDNHLQALGQNSTTPIADAVAQLRGRLSHTVKIEVEADNLDQVRALLEVPGVEVILLDNMRGTQMREAVAIGLPRRMAGLERHRR